ncbi:uncharacterized protein LOC106473508 [Limulus polyphemus]|uniref:Uncharacterized protein LOC106473508 n=1 Tax=Limulus polyphemus TaxID=6850 RepID=A0ABM1BVT4_LIMPO|nr:uncharacterized protein LOC106473508 [Limulus polyphemus]
MAFRVIKRKDVKKQSYYVWFLGAKESKGLRGEEYIRPVLNYFLDKERELEPMKVTLQVSNKGIKIIQNVPRKNNRGKTEQIKHFIPHHAITCVVQEQKPDDDIVCAILLLYNPVTECPVHIHAYRCDSVETATNLRSQLQILIDRPENQKKFQEIENRLAVKGLLPSRKLNSDGRSTHTDLSDPLEDSFGSDTEFPVRKEHVTNLYDSLAAELRERLNNQSDCPILLPPKDYDADFKRQSKIGCIEQKKNSPTSIVGMQRRPQVSNGRPTRAKESSSSGKSSGIGSDEALSSAIQEVASHPEFENKEIDPDTSSDEEDWPEPEPLVENEVVRQNWRRDILPGPPRSPSSAIHAPRPVLPVYSDLKLLPVDDDESINRLKGFKSDQEKVKEPIHGGWKEYRDNPLPFSYHLPQVTDLKNRFNKQALPDDLDIYKVRSSSKDDNERIAMHRKKRTTEVLSPGVRNYRSSSQSNIRSLNRDGTPSPPLARYAPLEVARQRHQPDIERDRLYMYESRLARYSLDHADEITNQLEEHNRRIERFNYPRQSHSADPRTAIPDSYPCRRSQSPEPYPGRPARRPVERYIDKRRSQPDYLLDERRRSGYFDLPADTRDYRHSFTEPNHRRLPINSNF